MTSLFVNERLTIYEGQSDASSSTISSKEHEPTGGAPTITLSPPPTTGRRKRSIYRIFQQQQEQCEKKTSSALGRRLSNLSLRTPQTSRPPSPCTEAVGAAAVAASLAAAFAVGGGGQQQYDDQDDDEDDDDDEAARLHPNAAYQLSSNIDTPPSPSSSTLSSPRSESPTVMFREMKRALSQYQQTRRFSLGRRRASTTKVDVDDRQGNASQVSRRALLHEKYGRNTRKGRSIGRGATAVIKLLEPSDPSQLPGAPKIVAVKRFRKKDRDETERDYQKRMTNEYCISKVLQHAHIVQTFDLLQDSKGRWCTVMEYVSFTHHHHHYIHHSYPLYIVFRGRRLYYSQEF